MSGKNEFEKRADAALSRWAQGERTWLRLVVAGASLVFLGFILGGFLWRP